VNVFTQYLLSVSNKHRFSHIYLCQEHFRYQISPSLSHMFASHIWLLQLFKSKKLITWMNICTGAIQLK